MKSMLVLPLLTALLACRPVSVHADPKPALPAAYAVPTGTTPAAARWWTGFHDPALDALVSGALDQSPDIQAAQARFRQARALQGAADAQGGPNLNLNGKVTRDKLSTNSEMFANIPVKTVKTDFTNFQVGFDASWELDLFGHNRSLAGAAKARAEAASERLADARLVLSAEVARNYFELRGWQNRLDLAREITGILDEQVRIAAVARAAGETSDQDLRQAEQLRAAYRASLPTLQVALRQNLAALSALTGRDVQDLETRLSPAQPLPSVPPPPAAGVPSDLLNHRPDLRAAARDLAATSSDVAAAVSSLYPKISLVGQGGWNSIQSGTLLTNASRLWSLGPQLSLPLFNRGLLRSQVKANEAAFDVSLAGYHKAVLTAVADVDVAFTRMARNEERRQELQEAETRQRAMAALTDRQFQAGDVSKASLLQARRALLDQQDQLVQAHGQSLTALVAIHKTLGAVAEP
jgi:NodT family efflux transporter outer membrane factor (OMF) lipoprotein